MEYDDSHRIEHDKAEEDQSHLNPDYRDPAHDGVRKMTRAVQMKPLGLQALHSRTRKPATTCAKPQIRESECWSFGAAEGRDTARVPRLPTFPRSEGVWLTTIHQRIRGSRRRKECRRRAYLIPIDRTQRAIFPDGGYNQARPWRR